MNFGMEPISITEPLTVKELAAKLRLSETVIIKHLFYRKDVMRTINEILDVALAQEVIHELSDPDSPPDHPAGVPRKQGAQLLHCRSPSKQIVRTKND